MGKGNEIQIPKLERKVRKLFQKVHSNETFPITSRTSSFAKLSCQFSRNVVAGIYNIMSHSCFLAGRGGLSSESKLSFTKWTRYRKNIFFKNPNQADSLTFVLYLKGNLNNKIFVIFDLMKSGKEKRYKVKFTFLTDILPFSSNIIPSDPQALSTSSK